MSWGDVASPEGLKKTILAVVVGIVLVIVGAVGADIAAGVGNYILQVLNKTGFTITASANYVAPIESVPSLVFLILRLIGVVILIIMIIVVLLKRYDGLTA